MMDVQTSYDRVSAEYAARFGDEMSYKPFDRLMLDWLIAKVDGRGPICDMGCGPGQIARYLHSRGAPACGIDLSPEMVAQARRLNPEISFQQGDMLALTGFGDQTLGGIAAFYTLIHIPRERMVHAMTELKRVLRPGGALLATFHIGQQTVHLDEWWGHTVSMDFIHFERPEMKEFLQQAGFDLEEAIERDPNPDIEHQSRRAYLFARKPER
jgi:SAM-dependent methyltransferase